MGLLLCLHDVPRFLNLHNPTKDDKFCRQCDLVRGQKWESSGFRFLQPQYIVQRACRKSCDALRLDSRYLQPITTRCRGNGTGRNSGDWIHRTASK